MNYFKISLLIIALAAMHCCVFAKLKKSENSLNAIDASLEEDSSDDSTNIIEKLKEQIKHKEEELETAEKVNKNFERMVQLVNIMGQVDAFLTDRTKLVLKKLAALADNFDEPDSSNKKYDITF